MHPVVFQFPYTFLRLPQTPPGRALGLVIISGFLYIQRLKISFTFQISKGCVRVASPFGVGREEAVLQSYHINRVFKIFSHRILSFPSIR